MKTTHEILELIRKHKTFLLSAHVNPDPDAICSVLALGAVLRQMGKKVLMVLEEDVPKRYAFFPSAHLIKKINPKIRYSFDAALILDCGDLDRIGKVKSLLTKGVPVINIDHHVTNTRFGTVNHVVPDASSTAEVLYDLIKAAKGKLNKHIAYNLYAGILTDTGSFRYENTTAKTHRVVSDLMEYSFCVSDLYRVIYERIPLKDLTAFVRVINDFTTYCRGKIVCVMLTKKIQKGISENFDLRDAVFKYLRAVEGVEVIFIVSEGDKKTTRVNFRSTQSVDVSKIASTFDGGGHKRASGCALHLPLLQARNRVLKEIKRVL